VDPPKHITCGIIHAFIRNTRQFNQITVSNSHYNEYISSIQNDAVISLQQMFRYSIQQCIPPTRKSRTNWRFELNKLLPGSPPSFLSTTQRENTVQKYPFMHAYDTDIEPMTSEIVTIDGLKVVFINVGGGAKDKLHHNHPKFRHIVQKHHPDLIIALDTRLKSVPTWKLKGFRRVSHKNAPTKNIDGTVNHANIGGILVYRNKDLTTKIDTTLKHPQQDIMWLKLMHKQQQHYLAICYCRPYKTANKTMCQKFHQTIDKDIAHFRSITENIWLIGDFNAHIPSSTGAAHRNQNGTMLSQILTKHHLKIQNPFWAHRIHSYVGGGNGTFIDFVIGQDSLPAANDGILIIILSFRITDQ